MHIFLHMQPPRITQQMHRVGISKSGKPYVYEQAELKEARSQLRAALSKHRPAEPINGPVRLYTIWCFDRAKAKKHKDGEWKITKPDTDNLIKMLKDVMTDLGWWNDDAQVAAEQTEKHWADVPGIYIEWGRL